MAATTMDHCPGSGAQVLSNEMGKAPGVRVASCPTCGMRGQVYASGIFPGHYRVRRDVVVTWATDGSSASAVRDSDGRVRIYSPERDAYGWAHLSAEEWEGEA